MLDSQHAGVVLVSCVHGTISTRGHSRTTPSHYATGKSLAADVFPRGGLRVVFAVDDGPTVFYFFFCDPGDRNAVCFSGVSAPHVRDVLFKRRPLDEYLAVADRIRRLEA